MDQFSKPYDPMSPLDPQGDRSKVPPPPPSYDQQVGIRTMASDQQSIQQSGGESPQSQIMSANEVFKAPDASAYTGMSAAPQFTPPPVPTPAPSSASFSSSPANAGVVIEPPVHKSSLKTILLVALIAIIAAGVGYGVYYLITSMQSEPAVPAVVPEFSVAPSEMPSPLVTVPSQSPLVHASLITAPAKIEALALTAVTLADFKTALAAASAKDKLLVGTVKDLSFATEAEQPVSAQQFLQSFFPTAATNLSFMFEQDFTAWLYGDKTGGNKFGVILGVKPEVSTTQLQASLVALESNYSEAGNMFLSAVGAPEQAEGFKSGPISGVSVRYLAFSAKNQQVFEYAPVQIGTKTYVVIATSYYQMQHILKLLNAKPVAAAAPSAAPSVIPTTTPAM